MKREVKKNLLIVDDDAIFSEVAAEALAGERLNVLTATRGVEGLAICSQKRVDVLLLDQKLPDGEGTALCSAILAANEETKIIFITAYPSFSNAVKAIKAGAHDYLSKPFEMDELRLAVDRALRTLDLEQTEKVQSYQSSKEGEQTVLIGEHGGLSEIRQLIRLAAENKAPILITGETGTGKNLVAKAIHYRSNPTSAPFITINCAALPESLIEGELFGYDRGAFTGAQSARKGLFEMAEGGTLFLDEIGAMPLHLQSKLLGVLDDSKIRRLGGQTERTVDVRIIAATNAQLEKEIRAGRFREDLYFRLSVLRCHIPPLRERKDDIPELCRFFIQRFHREDPLILPPEEIPALQAYPWPGNVRELKNVLERSMILRQGKEMRPSALLSLPINPSLHSLTSVSPKITTAHILPLLEMEKQYLQTALQAFQGNVSQTAQALKISRSTLKRKMKEMNLATDSK